MSAWRALPTLLGMTEHREQIWCYHLLALLTACGCLAARACKKDVKTFCKEEKKTAKEENDPALVLVCLKCARRCATHLSLL